MRFILILLIFLFSYPLGAFALDEQVTLNDGRNLILKDDGTYQFIQIQKKRWQDFVAHTGSTFKRQERDYSEAIIYMPLVENKTERTIIGIEFVAKIKDAFGNVKYSFKGTIEERVKPGKISQAKLFYVFKDNPFIDGEPYDKMLSTVTNKTGKDEIEVLKVVFEGGEILSFDD